MVVVHEDEGRALLESDSPWFGAHALIFRPRAISALGPVLSNNGELLPLSSGADELFLFNATRVIDALDECASSVTRFSSGRPMHIQRHIFRPEMLGGADLFKIPNLTVSPAFVSERVVQLWKDTRLRGLDFEEIWRPR